MISCARCGRATAARALGTPGYVETPYTIDDLKSVLAAVSDDAAFAEDFFARYIQGREVVDFKRDSSPRRASSCERVQRGRAFAGAAHDCRMVRAACA